MVLRFVIARDGRLIEASIAKSSGIAALDRGLLEVARCRATPYGRLAAGCDDPPRQRSSASIAAKRGAEVRDRGSQTDPLAWR